MGMGWVCTSPAVWWRRWGAVFGSRVHPARGRHSILPYHLRRGWKIEDYGLRMDERRWTMDDGRTTMDSRWPIDDRPPTADRRRTTMEEDRPNLGLVQKPHLPRPLSGSRHDVA